MKNLTEHNSVNLWYLSLVSLTKKLSFAAILALAVSCGDASISQLESTRQHEPIDDPNALKSEFSVEETCAKKRTVALVEEVLLAAELIGKSCEKQNVLNAQNGYVRCPINSCMNSYENGGLQAPSMEITITNSESSSSFSFGSSSALSSGGRGAGDQLYFTVTLKVNLTKDPDKIICVNPISPSSLDKVMDEIILLNRNNSSC